MPEFDGRIISVPFSFKEVVTTDSTVGGAVTKYVPVANRVQTVVGLAVTLGAFFGARFRGSQAETSVRFLVSSPQGSAFASVQDSHFLALSPDGSQLALVAATPAGATRVWLRPLSAFDARPVAGTDGATSAFWSPDARSLAFFADGKLKRVNLADNAILTVCVAEGSGLTGTWGSDGRMLFAPVSSKAIFSVPAAGGTPTAEVRPNESRGETVVQWPRFLPDGRRFVYIARQRDGSRTLMLVEERKAPRPLLLVASGVEWVDPDYVVFATREGTLVARRVDLSSGRIVGEPFLIAQSVDYSYGTGRAMFTVRARPSSSLPFRASIAGARLKS
jgi:Tol biopolymer transport system component